MNGNSFQSLKQKGIQQDGNYVKTSPFYAEGNGTKKDVRYSPKIKEIRTLAEFFALLKEIHDKNESRLKSDEKECGSLFLYRGQGNVNFNYSPTILRLGKHINREHLLQKEFHRRFFEKMDNFKTIFDEEVLMQHYGVGSRCLDLLENPLAALWAACETDSTKEFEKTFGEVSFWCLDNEDDDLKVHDSSTVSIIANTAICEPHFSLGHLEINYHKEHPTEMADFIYLKDIIRRTVVARPKYNNIHFTYQQNCFAIMNLNKLVDDDGKFYKKFGITVERFSDYILNAEILNKDKDYEYQYPNVKHLRENKHTLNADFSKLTSWDLWFDKEVPDNSTFVDTFDLYRYMYNDSSLKNERIPIFAVVPPDAKKSLLKELEYMNITDAAIYPDMEHIAKELQKKFALQETSK